MFPFNTDFLLFFWQWHNRASERQGVGHEDSGGLCQILAMDTHVSAHTPKHIVIQILTQIHFHFINQCQIFCYFLILSAKKKRQFATLTYLA